MVKVSKKYHVRKKGAGKSRLRKNPIKRSPPQQTSSFSAETVLRQLGGNKFIAMTGAKNFVKDDAKRMIGFKIGRNSKSINYVRITLNLMDTYDMEFLMIRANKITVRSKSDGVYNDQLQDVFTEHTGMNTHL